MMNETHRILCFYLDLEQYKIAKTRLRMLYFMKPNNCLGILCFIIMELEIVNKLTYLGIVFTSGGSFNETQNTLVGQDHKAFVQFKKYTLTFTDFGVF